MGSKLTMYTGNMAKVTALIGLDPDDVSRHQRFRLSEARRDATAADETISAGNIDLGPLSIAEALEEILAARDKNPEGAQAYRHAAMELIRGGFSAKQDLGVWSRPFGFFSEMSEDLARLDVAAPLHPMTWLADSPFPAEFGLPDCEEPLPDMGYLPTARAQETADAYAAVLGHLDTRFTAVATLLYERLKRDAEEYAASSYADHIVFELR